MRGFTLWGGRPPSRAVPQSYQVRLAPTHKLREGFKLGHMQSLLCLVLTIKGLVYTNYKHVLVFFNDYLNIFHR